MKDNEGTMAFLISLAGIISFFLLILALASYSQCKYSWAKSGFSTSWGPLQGCLIQIDDNTWIPQENIREMDLIKHKNRTKP